VPGSGTDTGADPPCGTFDGHRLGGETTWPPGQVRGGGSCRAVETLGASSDIAINVAVESFMGLQPFGHRWQLTRASGPIVAEGRTIGSGSCRNCDLVQPKGRVTASARA
jgi:hypothetical protein